MAHRIAAPAAGDPAPPPVRPSIPRQRPRPLVVLERLLLSEGSALVHREVKSERRHHIAWDPAQITRDKVEIWINIYIAGENEYDEISPATWRNLVAIAKLRRADDCEAVAEIWDIVEDTLVRTDDPKGTFERLCQLLRAEAERRAAPEQVPA